MAKAKATMKIVVPLASLSPDPIQYKPYAPRFDLTTLAVEVDIPADLFIRHDKKTGLDIFHPDAVPLIAHQLSLSIAKNYKPAIPTNR